MEEINPRAPGGSQHNPNQMVYWTVDAWGNPIGRGDAREPFKLKPDGSDNGMNLLPGFWRKDKVGIDEFRGLFRTLDKKDDFQLKFPLDPQSGKMVKDISLIPVNETLAGTAPATGGNYTTFFIADRPYQILSVTEIHGTAGTDGSAVTLNVEKLDGTDALDAGVEVLSTSLSLKATANTVQYGTLKNTEAVLLTRGDRLALKDAGTLTAVANLTVTVLLKLL